MVWLIDILPENADKKCKNNTIYNDAISSFFQKGFPLEMRNIIDLIYLTIINFFILANDYG